MDIPFVTLPIYDGLVLPVLPQGDAMGGEQDVRWLETDDVPSWAYGATEQIFRQRNDQLQKIYRLDYPDINGLGNRIYRLDGKELRFCLKILGDSEGNEREPLVWEILGYGEAFRANMQTFKQIRGLPPAKFLFFDRNLRTVLTPYYQGVLKAISGGGYEFPLVLCATLFVEETLHQLHGAGLAYMDLCPSNILFSINNEGAMLFYLTDMGGVKPLVNHPDHPLFQELCQAVIPRRWTRREVLPPAHLFEPSPNNAHLETQPTYDFYTLARTAQVLLGCGSEEEPLYDLSHDELCLEDPLRPLASERQLFLQLLQPWLKGQALSGDGRAHIRSELQHLFLSFFQRRADFAANYFEADAQGDAAGGPGAHWREHIASRFSRYRMALPPTVFVPQREELEQRLKQEGSGLKAELQLFQELAAAVCASDPDRCLRLLEAAAASRLVRLSRVANTAFFHHKRLVRALFGGVAEQLERIGAKLHQLQTFADEPEAATLKAVRRGRTPLGQLQRRF